MTVVIIGSHIDQVQARPASRSEIASARSCYEKDGFTIPDGTRAKVDQDGMVHVLSDSPVQAWLYIGREGSHHHWCRKPR